jgi:hypothetical protein
MGDAVGIRYRGLAWRAFPLRPGPLPRVLAVRRIPVSDLRSGRGGARRGRAPAARAAARISVIIVRQVIADDRAGDDAPGLL